MTVRKLQLAIMAAGLAGAMSASAVTLTFDNVDPSQTVNLTDPWISSGANAGIYNLTVDGVATPSFCIDVADENNGNTFSDYYYSDLASAPLAPAGPMGATAATDVEKLWAAYYSPSMDSLDAAALQVAMWEDIAAKAITPYSITVSGNDPVTTEATAMIANLVNLSAQADLVGLVGPNGPSGEQSYVVAVPEPTTAGCFLLGLGALACFLVLETKSRRV
ncbi:MAG: hypothetical protein ABSC89_11200 [Verrucomicrobiota bacterium]|jgi:hypothetical protein